MSEIESAQWADAAHSAVRVTYASGACVLIPADPGNTDYRRLVDGCPAVMRTTGPVYARHSADVPALDASGNVRRAPGGETLYKHRAGDLVRDAAGEPVVASAGGEPVLDAAGDPVIDTPALAPVVVAEYVPDANAIRAEARRRILARYPEWRQQNMTARAVELVDKGVDNLTSEEAAERAAIAAAWEWIKSVRAASNDLEASTPADYLADTHWPA